MESIEKQWPLIKGVIEENVIQAVGAGPAYATPEEIYRRMFPG
jgi:hypothetical protein